MESSRQKVTSYALDVLSLGIGWLLLLSIDPWMAVVGGTPLALLLLVLRRRWWNEQYFAFERPATPSRRALLAIRHYLWNNTRLTGRLAAALFLPVIVFLVTAYLALNAVAPLAGVVGSLLLFAALEAVSRRRGASLLRHYPLLTAVAFVLASAGTGVVLLEAGVGQWPTEDFVKRLSATPAPVKWPVEARRQAVKAIRDALRSEGEEQTAEQRVASQYRKLSRGMDELKNAPSPHGIYVTLYDYFGYRVRGFSDRGRDSLDRLLGALSDALSNKPYKPRSDRSPAGWRPRARSNRIQIDVAGPMATVTYRPFFEVFSGLLGRAHRSLRRVDPLGPMFNLAFEIEPGVDGMEIRVPGKQMVSLLLPSDPITEGWLTPRVRSAPAKLHAMISRAWYRGTRERIDLAATKIGVRKFRTLSFGEHVEGAGPVGLYRGNRLLPVKLEREFLVGRTVLAAEWLSRQLLKPRPGRERGTFHYESFPPYRSSTRDYNLPRHAGSVYGLFAYYNAALEEPAFEESGERALRAGLTAFEYIERNLGPPRGEAVEDICFLEADGSTTSGATALAAMAVAELPPADRVERPGLRERVANKPIEKWLSGMGTCMVNMIDPVGAVHRSYRSARNNPFVKKEPLYFPGEVMLGLVRAHERLGDEKLLEGAARIGDRQLRKYRLNLAFDIPRTGDHWIIQALAELAEATGEKKYAELSLLMARGYLREQHPPMAYLYADYRGAYYRVADIPRTTRAASRGEALGGAMKAARLLGEDTSALRTGLVEGARHLVEQQFIPANSFFVPGTFDLEGAIRMGLVDNHCRIDNNQHGLVALLAALRAMDDR
jgi:hypothetical protein